VIGWGQDRANNLFYLLSNLICGLRLFVAVSFVYLFSFASLTAWANYCGPVINYNPPPPHERWRLATTPRSWCPSLFKQCVGVLHHTGLSTLKSRERGPTVYLPYPRMLESLTICRCDYKGSTFYSVKTLSVAL